MNGSGKTTGLASYLLFESAYCGELMKRGYEDGMRMSGEIREFLA